MAQKISRRSKLKTKVKKSATFTEYDSADYIEDKDDVIAHLKVALEENDPDFLLRTIEDIARSKGMSKLAREIGIDRAGLNKALAPDGNPSFKTVFKLLDVLGFHLKIEPKAA